MPKQSVLRFNDYTVNEIMFKDLLVPEESDNFELKPKFAQKLVEAGENQYAFTLSVEILSTEERQTPFDLKVSITGYFSVEGEDDNLSDEMKKTILTKNTAAILFPFLRTIVATITMNANIPALLLPIMNFADNA